MTARARTPEDVLYNLRPQPSQTWQQQRPAHRPPTVTDAAAITFMAERAAAEARLTSSRHPSKPAPQAHDPPRTRPEQRQGEPAVSLPPYQPSMSVRIQRMPPYGRHHKTPTQPGGEDRARVPAGPYPPTPPLPTEPHRTGLRGLPGPATATSLHDPTTPTHAHSSAQGHGPTHGQWWQRCTHTQLWELRKWARAEPSLESMVHRPRKGSAENCRLQPAGLRLPQAAWEAMLADVLQPQGVHLRNLIAPQNHSYVLRHLQETFQATGREGRRLWDITRSPTPRTHLPSPPRKRPCTDTGSTQSTLHATQHDALDPPAGGATS